LFNFFLQRDDLVLRLIKLFRKSSDMRKDILGDVSFAVLSQVGLLADFAGDGGQRTDLQMQSSIANKDDGRLGEKLIKKTSHQKVREGQTNLIIGFAVVRTDHLVDALEKRRAVGDQVRFTRLICSRAMSAGQDSGEKRLRERKETRNENSNGAQREMATFRGRGVVCGYPSRGASQSDRRHRRICRRKSTTERKGNMHEQSFKGAKETEDTYIEMSSDCSKVLAALAGVSATTFGIGALESQF
jgi:hypothetical protein